MHFKNGREARTGDPVIGPHPFDNKTALAGVIHNLRSGEICNCDIAVPIIGGSMNYKCRNVSNYYHAEDALKAIEPQPVPSAP